MTEEEEVKRLTEDLRKIAENLGKLIDMANIKMREINRVVQRETGEVPQQPVNFGKTSPPFLQQREPRTPPEPVPSTSPPAPQNSIQEEPGTPVKPKPSMELKNVSTGVEKLDELLMGGVRTSSNALLIGPPYSNKYTLAWNFVGKSLEDDIPVIVITTDKDIKEIKYEVGLIYENVEEAEENGLLKFVDVYSKSIQSESPSDHAIVIDNLINVSSLMKNIDTVAAKMRENHPYYRLLFSSLTSYVNELDERVLLKFIQQFVQKRKSENCISFNMLESGLFEKKLIEAISYLMDGSIVFRTEGAKGFLKVEGLGQARSREWVEIYPMDTSFDLGAFTLEKIR